MKFIERNKERIRFVLGVITSVMTVAAGVLFIISCYSIYKSGDAPFTRESISEAFSKIAIPVYVSICFIVLGICFGVIFPKEEEKLKGKRTDLIVMKKLYAKADLGGFNTEIGERVKKEEKFRRILVYVNAALLILSTTLPLIYLLNPDNFPAVSGEYNAEIKRGMLVCLLCLTPLFIYEFYYVIAYGRSVKREIELLRRAPISVEGKSVDKTDKVRDFVNNNKHSLVLGVRIALIGCAAVFIILGISNGGMSDVLNKAINICTECIGLG